MIARCAGPEKFFGLTDLIYKSQEKWTRAGDDAAIVNELSKLAKVAGLNDRKLILVSKIQKNYARLLSGSRLNASNDEDQIYSIFLINGEKFSNWVMMNSHRL